MTVAGAHATANLLVVKYNSSGVAQWARSTVVASTVSSASGIALDSTNNVYVSGQVLGNNTLYSFGVGVTFTPANNGNYNGVVVKYDNNGTPLFVKSATVAPSDHSFYDLAIDGSNNFYVVGRMLGNGTYNFGDGVSVAGYKSAISHLKMLP